MASDTTLRAAAPMTPTDRSSPLTRLSSVLAWGIVALLVALFVEVFFEGWVQQIAGHNALTKAGSEIRVLADWPKTVKTLLFFGVAALTVGKLAVDRRWRDLTSKADLALVGVAFVMVVAGVLGGSKLGLIGQALFVYFRGVIVFYAWRALHPSRRVVTRILLGVGAFALFSAAIAIVQTVLGIQTYRLLGWTDMTWAKINRAHALFNHPNHLGHFLMIVMLGLLAWFVTLERVGRKWWWLFGALAFGLSATQSRESTIGIVLGAGVIWLLRRPTRMKPIAIALVLVIGFAGLQLVVTPANRAVLYGRLAGFISAIQTPAGAEVVSCQPGDPECTDSGVPRREIRLLFAQQGGRLWLKKPLLGYGVGKFGGIVAYKADPKWYEKLHFQLYGAKPDQVDSFWLHLLVETGLLGVLAYLLWLYFLVAPIVRSRTRGAGVHPFVLWAPAVMVASLFVALLSPSQEDQLYPTLLFTVLGLTWVVLRRGESAGAVPATGLNGPATSDGDLEPTGQD